MRALEERGIGRPSTYASIMGTILDRGYVRKVGQALVPTFLAFAVTGLLEQHFSRLVDYEFTALMEDDLDRIAAGDEERTAWLKRFYFGEAGGDEGLKALVSDLGDIDARQVNTIEIGNGIELRVGRYGPYIERNGERVTISDEIAPDELTVAKAEELLSQATDQRELGVNPETGRAILVKNGRYGPYVTEEADDGEKPRTASLFKSMSPESVTLEDVLPLLALPRIVGVDPGTERGGDRRERPLRPVREARQGHPLARDRGAAADDHARRDARAARPAEAARPQRDGRRRRSASSATTRSAASRSS